MADPISILSFTIVFIGVPLLASFIEVKAYRRRSLNRRAFRPAVEIQECKQNVLNPISNPSS
jgi:hypothetical protein